MDYRNIYKCESCDKVWRRIDSSVHNDRCPRCNAEIEPLGSTPLKGRSCNVYHLCKDFKGRWSGKEIKQAILFVQRAVSNDDFEVFEAEETGCDEDVMVFGPEGISDFPNIGMKLHDLTVVSLPGSVYAGEIAYHYDQEEKALYGKLILPDDYGDCPEELQVLLDWSPLRVVEDRLVAYYC